MRSPNTVKWSLAYGTPVRMTSASSGIVPASCCEISAGVRPRCASGGAPLSSASARLTRR